MIWTPIWVTKETGKQHLCLNFYLPHIPVFNYITIHISWVNMMEASESFLLIVCSLTRKVYRNYLFINLFISLPHKCQRGTDKRKLRTCKTMLCNQECYLAWLWHLNLRHQNFRSIMNISSIEELWNYNFMHYA